MKKSPTLTHDEHKAAEAAFQGLPLDPAWTNSAQTIYHGLREAMLLRKMRRMAAMSAEREQLQDREPVLS